ncbi:hypothetical protein G6F59_000461 [Rhizopus arrhizus]|nr:hypothetical protein G6F59_000461 [Rhizopus arrhizus]
MSETQVHQRSFSVMAVPSEFEQHRRKQSVQCFSENKSWHEEVYKRYGYQPKHKVPAYFGPYLLLQTLGEGEFAKVKAGVHVETEQDVSKLEKIQASLETKLEREISVLKSVCHPHIVSLYEVLNIKNYIGIVLQRAFGGELFDYILKHRFLQENEAKRLFAQLISGVHYMHQKHIVHRDLKLENLLLSKDRDIIITDFGFANRFKLEHQDLMVTSCGSPCYAAPELVISDDENIHYVGTAVDIWSCGVILFAMLCGYLPFDDDPNNPQGTNIHLLYKYIINTPLELPSSMSEEAKDLLKRMLVPDPSKRCTMDEIRSHPWLEEYHDLLYKSIKELESSDTRLSISVSHVQNNTQTNNTSESREQRHGADCVTNHEEEEEDEDMPPLEIENNATEEDENRPSTPEEEEKKELFEQEKTNSMFQSKFFSVISRHVSVKRPQSPNIPIRSSSTAATSRQRAISDIQDNHHYQPTLSVLPSVSEQTIMNEKRSKGQKLKDWFKRNSKHTSTKFGSTERVNLSERPVSSSTIYPIRAMPIGKPLGSYAADFNDSKLRIHRGTVDQDALTSKAPNEVLFTIKEALDHMGISLKRIHDFKVKCIRPSRHASSKRNSLKLLFNNSHHQHHPPTTIYGEQGIDTGEEVQFSVELSKIENLPGLYVVDIRRIRGSIWAYKFLYHTLLDLLDLRQSGYMTQRKVSKEKDSHRMSSMTASTHSTNDL